MYTYYVLLNDHVIYMGDGVSVTGLFRFVKQDQVVIARLQTAGVICLETFKEFPQMARFTLRDEGEFTPVSVSHLTGSVTCMYMYM